MEFTFTDDQVHIVSTFLQGYMRDHNIESMTPDECAPLLAERQILSNKVGPKPAFNFREMLRQGRDGLIPLIAGAEQARPRARWAIHRVS